MIVINYADEASAHRIIGNVAGVRQANEGFLGGVPVGHHPPPAEEPVLGLT